MMHIILNTLQCLAFHLSMFLLIFFIGGLSISGRDSMIEAKRSAVEMSCEIVLGMGFLTLVAMLLLH